MSIFLESPSDAEINIILAVVSQHIIDAGHRSKYHNSYYQPCLEDPRGLIPKFFLKGIKALVIKAFDGTLLVSIKEEIYILKEVEQRKALSEELDLLTQRINGELGYASSDILRTWKKESRYSQHDASWRI